MKKFLAPLTAGIVSAQLLATKAFAQLAEPPPIEGLTDETDITTVIVDLLKKALDFVLLIAVIFVVVAGIRLIVSGGDEGEKDKAKKTIIYVVVGILVILLARVVVTFVAGLI